MRNPLRMFRRRGADAQPQPQPTMGEATHAEKSTPPRSPRSPIEVFEAGGGILAAANPITQEILRGAEETHRSRQRDQDAGDPDQP